MLVAFLITATLLIAEVIGAAWTGSLALLTDAGHMLTDVLGLGVALLAARLMQLPPTPRRTWGFARAEVLSAGVQAGILLFVGLYAAVEGVHRLVDPTDVPPVILLVFGVIGLAGNLATMAVLAGGRNANLNMRAAFLEVVNDALGSVAVIVGAVVIATTGWLQADAIAGLFIAALIVPRALRILREAMSVLLESAPAELDLTDVRAHILSMDHVVDVHDLHVSRIATNMPVLTAHVVVEDACFTNGRSLDVLDTLEDCVASHFSISIRHSTFQLEPARHRDHESDLGH
ncbi:MAG: cation diffusion facilitator family transporter [Dermatophilaceae bacterium]